MMRFLSVSRRQIVFVLLVAFFQYAKTHAFHIYKNGVVKVEQMRVTTYRSSLCLSKTAPEEETQFDSLDVVLKRARKRNRLPLLMGKVQSALNKRFLPFVSIGDVLVVVAALVPLDAKGFAVGLVIGKATLAPLRRLLTQQEGGEVVVKLIDFYPAVLAIILDQFI